ncbi:VIT family-domain-containing protein [Hypoxylon sp. FL1284]|nr:VIT family-domain-containing protein [Hypoxylon sp. FL1284]
MQFLPQLDRQGQSSQESLPTYSVIGTDPKELNDIRVDNETTRTDHLRSQSQSRQSQFLSHFTLGFADGLTVPFALTAGLSSLGHTRTVIYAGMAEICAGCISMGIGGYLAAREQAAAKPDDCCQSRKLEAASEGTVQSYLTPLGLPPDILQLVEAHIDQHPTVLGRLSLNRSPVSDDLADTPRVFPPAIVGLSVSFGYLIGGLLPLFPYFFVGEVGEGLRWSFLVCVLALFAFGFSKELVLRHRPTEDVWSHENAGGEAVIYERAKQGCFEGMRMVVMGGAAAIAAVLCVRFSEHIVS